MEANVLNVGDTMRISVALLREIYENGALHTSVPAIVAAITRDERNEVTVDLQRIPDSRLPNVPGFTPNVIEGEHDNEDVDAP